MTILGANVRVPPGVQVKPSDQAWNPTLVDWDFWWRADAVTITSGKISQLADLSGNGVTASQSTPALQFTPVAVDANLGGRPSMFTNFGQLMVADSALALAWFGVVCTHSAASFGGIFEVLAARESGGNYLLQGNAIAGTDWMTTTLPGVRKRDGVITDVALTGAQVAHFYEFIPTTPVSGALHLANNNAFNAGWQGNIAEAYGKTTVPTTSDILNLRAYLTGYYSRQM